MVKIPLERATRLVNHGPLVLVGTTDGEKHGVAPVAWCMPCSKAPPRFILRIGSGHFTFQNIMANGDLTLNVPGVDLAPKALAAGRISGKVLDDKFSHVGLRPVPGELVSAPRVEECVAWLECRLVDKALAETHGLVMVEACGAWARDGAWLEADCTIDVARFPTLHHLGGPSFCGDKALG